MTSPQEAFSNSHLSGKIGIDDATLDRLGLEEAKAKYGCVVRSFESALGAKATDVEWELRLRLFRQTERRLINDTDAVARTLLENRDNITRLLQHLEVSETPLGKNFRKFQYKIGKLIGGQIHTRVRNGVNLIVSTQDNTHMAHLQYDGSEIRSKSDDGNPVVSLGRFRLYDTIIFTPKPKQ
ncbi:MAG TPA: hypothetical protein VLG67_05510 [Candidatus Saccharimonadales bacterium]|nr:hypothetical protein [Candidatus Saccharimonadales bacterium]